MSEFKVRVGVDVDVSDIQSQLSKANLKPIEVEARLSDSSIRNIASQLNNGSKNNHVKIDVDTSSARRDIASFANETRIQVSTISSQMQRLNSLKLDIKDEGLAATFTRLKKTLTEISSIEKKIGKLDIDTNSNQIVALESRLKELNKTYTSLRSKLEEKLNSNQFAAINDAIGKTQSELTQLSAKILDAKNNLGKNITDGFNLGDYKSQFSNMVSQIRSLSGESEKLNGNIKQLGASYKELNAAVRSGDTDRIISAQKQWANTMQEVANKTKIAKDQQKALAAEQKQISAQSKISASAKQLSFQIDNWLMNNSAAASMFGSRLEAIQLQLRNCDATTLNNLKNEFREVTLEAQLAGKTGLNFGDRLKAQWSKYGAYIGASSVVFGGMQAMRQMYQNVLDVDTAMTELYRVTDLTSTQYSDLYDKMVSSAKEYGVVLSDLIGSTADWSRAGFSASDASDIAEITSIYQHIADLDYSTAVENLLTAYKGFENELKSDFAGDSVESIRYIGDILNELDNNYAVTAAGLGEGIKRSASALEVAGNTIQETAGMIGGITEVTQDPEKAGNALKTVSMRLRGMKGQLEDLGEETDENVENLSKMQGQILKFTGGKVNIFDKNGDFKSTYEIFKGIAEVWDDLSSTDQAELLETVAGKHRANDVAALLQNWENVEKMVVSATNAEGSAAKEHEKYTQSMQGRIDSMMSAWQALSNTMMSSDLLGGMFSGFTSFLTLIDEVIDKIGLIPLALGGISAAMSLKGNGGLFSVIEDDASRFGARLTNIFSQIKNAASFSFSGSFKSQLNDDILALSQYKQAVLSGMDAEKARGQYLQESSDFARRYAETHRAAALDLAEFTVASEENAVAQAASNRSMKNTSSIIKAFNSDVERGALSQQQFATAVSTANPELGRYLSSLNGAKATFSGYITSLVGARVATIALSAASMALNAALTMGISALVSFGVSAIMSWINRADELAEKIDEVTTSYKDNHESLMSGKSDFDDLAESYANLSNGVDKLTGKNISLMPEEYEEYQSVVNQIADTIPSLVAGYDEQGNAILNCAGDVDTLTAAYNDLIIAENNKLLNGDGEDFNGLSDTIKDFQNDYKELQNSRDGWFGFDRKNTIASSDALEEMFGLPEVNKDTVKSYITSLDDFGEDVSSRFSTIGQTLKNKMSDMNLELTDVKTPDNVFSTGGEWAEYIAAVYNTYPEVVRSAIQDMDNELDSVAQETRDSISAYMENAFLSNDYSNIGEEMQAIISSAVGGLSGDFIHSIIGDKEGDDAANAIKGWVDNLLATINGLDSSVQDKLASSFDLQNSFSLDEISFGEYKSQLKEASDLIDSLDLDDEVKTQLKLSLNTEGIENDWQNLVNRLSSDEVGMAQDAAEDFVNSLSSSELEATQQLVIDGVNWEGKTPDEIKQEIASLADINEAMNFSIDISAETEGLENLNTALSESVSAAGMSAESLEILKSRYSSLDSYDPAKLFEKTSQGIRANRDEVSRLEQELAKTNLDNVSNSIETLQKAYADVTKELDSCSNATERQQKLAELTSYADQIEALSEMQAQYEGLTSAYNNWISAQEAGEEGDIYDDVITKLESAAELREQGLVGTNEFAAATEFMSGKDTTSMSVDEIVAAYDAALPKMQRYFVESSDGALNLLNDLSSLNEAWVSIGEDGSWDIDMSAEDIQDAAEQLGVSAEAIEAIFGKASDYGLEINYDSVYEATESLEAMRTTAQNANEALKKTKKTNMTFSFESDNVEDLNSQIESAKELLDKFRNEDGTINLDLEGAEEAQVILETLMLQKQEVAKPDIMSVDIVTIGDEKLGSAIQSLQQIQSYSGIYEVQVAIGADTSATEAKIADVVGQINSLKTENPQIFADLGLDTSEFNTALSTLSNNIEVGASLDPNAISIIQSSVQGINAEVLARVGLGDTSAVDGYTAPQKESNVQYNVDGSKVDSWQAPPKQGTITYNPYVGSLTYDQLNKTGTITYQAKIEGGGGVNGTANVNGTAFANGTSGRAFKQGDWGTKENGVALMGELGQELVVLSHATLPSDRQNK